MKCKAKDNKIYDITWKFFQGAYLPAVTVCAQQLFNLQKIIIGPPEPTCTDTLCGENCVDLQTDRDNCGDCGVQCSESQECVNGVCTDILTATHVNDAEYYTEDTPSNLTTIVINQINNQNVTLTLTLSNPNAGALSVATSGSTTSTYNAETGVWTASGPTDEVNILLSNVILTPALNYNSYTDGNFTIAVNISDGTNSITGLKDITVTEVNDIPIASNLNAAETYYENTNLNLTNIVVDDADDYSFIVTLTLSNPNAGVLSTSTSGITTSTYNAVTGVWTASGPTDEVNALLAGVTFIPSTNYNSNFTIATSVSDGVNSITGSKAITGVAANVAPILDNSRTPTLVGVSINASLPVGGVGTPIGGYLADFSIPTGGLDNVSDSDAHGLIGIAITAADSTNGTWYYTINNGSTWSALGAVSNNSARLLDNNSRIYFRPNTDFSGTINPAITFRAWDQTTGTNGGTANTAVNGGSTAFSTATDTASITVS